MGGGDGRGDQIVEAPAVAALLLKQAPLAGEEAEIFVVSGLELGPAIVAARARARRSPPCGSLRGANDAGHAANLTQRPFPFSTNESNSHLRRVFLAPNPCGLRLVRADRERTASSHFARHRGIRRLATCRRTGPARKERFFGRHRGDLVLVHLHRDLGFTCEDGEHARCERGPPDQNQKREENERGVLHGELPLSSRRAEPVRSELEWLPGVKLTATGVAPVAGVPPVAGRLLRLQLARKSRGSSPYRSIHR